MKIVEKAWEVDFSQILEGFTACDRVSWSNNRNKARKQLFEDIKYEDWLLRWNDEPITYLNIPTKRCKSCDKVEFEGDVIQRNKIDVILHKRIRIEYLDSILSRSEISYCYIKKFGDFYRPNSCGYTSHLIFAGVYGKEYAVSCAKSCEDLDIVPINIGEHNKMITDEIEDLKTRLINVK